MKTVLITGGAGFMGSHLAGRLLGEGLKVRILDNLSTGYAANLPDNNGSLSFIEGDIRDPVSVKKAVEGVSAVFHLAAVTSAPYSVTAPLETNGVNLSGTVRLLEAARDYSVRRFVFTSSAAVYGDAQTLPVREDSALHPISPYAIDKLAGEHYLSFFSRQHGIKTSAFRLFNVFGPRQNPGSPYSGVISRFIDAAINGRPVEIFGDGQQTRDFVFVDDAVEVLAKSLEMAGSLTEPVNIGSGNPTSLIDLAAALENVMGRKIEKVFKEPRPGDIRHSVASVERLRSVFGVTSSTGFADGLRKTVNHISSGKGAQASISAFL